MSATDLDFESGNGVIGRHNVEGDASVQISGTRQQTRLPDATETSSLKGEITSALCSLTPHEVEDDFEGIDLWEITPCNA